MQTDRKVLESCLYCKSRLLSFIGPIKNLDLTKLGIDSKLVECMNCGLMFLNPMPGGSFLSNIYGTSYHYDANPSKDKVINYYNSLFLRSDVSFIKKRIDHGKVLDIGFGRGDLLRLLPGKHWGKYGFEPFLSENEKISLEKALGAYISNDKSLKNIYPDNFFDLVILRNVIEHVSDFKDLIAEITRILKLGGFLFIRTPNINSFDFKLFKTDWYAVALTGHVVFFSEQCLIKICNDFGLKTAAVKKLLTTAPLSFYRSVKIKYANLPKVLLPAVMFGSGLYWVASCFFRNGVDLKVLMRKADVVQSN